MSEMKKSEIVVYKHEMIPATIPELKSTMASALSPFAFLRYICPAVSVDVWNCTAAKTHIKGLSCP